MHVYEPSEDTFLLRDNLPPHLEGMKVLEVGSGSGAVSVEAARRGADVVAVDVNPSAVQATRKAAYDAHVTVVACEGDLYEPVDDERFDLILCNPPYLPDEPKDPDVSVDGGPQGWEFIDRLLAGAKDHLTPEGKVLLIFSSHSKPDKVAISLHKHGFESKLLAKREMGFFEELFLVELVRDIPSKVNIIPFNPHPKTPFETPTEERIDQFQQYLIDNHVHVLRRATRGRDSMAACGQLGDPGDEEPKHVKMRLDEFRRRARQAATSG